MEEQSTGKSLLIGSNFFYGFVALQWIVSIYYVYLQYEEKGAAGDLPYVILILIGAHIAFFALKFQYRLLGENQDKLYDRPFVPIIFSDPLMLFSGLIYACAFVWVAVYAGAVTSSARTSTWLGILLFSNTFVIGAALYCLSAYLFFIYRIAGRIQVRLWNQVSDQMGVFSDSMWGMLVHVTLIVGIAIASLPFSYFKLDTMIWVFTIFCVGILLFSYYIPFMAIHRRINRLKQQKLKELGGLVEQEYEQRLTSLRKGEQEGYDLTRFNTLEQLYNKTKAVPFYSSLSFQTLKTSPMIMSPLLFAQFSTMIKNYFSQ